ncbi:nucleotide exchange factor GrpE [Methanomethylophilus alvi]|uniref:nucleotide exchange factor GrpE n=1 Tax=Methanomethylophilus alvi TaxID=1291540 RepID=UPI0037DC1E3C
MTDKSEKKDEKAPEQQEVKEAKKENKCQKKEIDELKARLEEEKENSAKMLDMAKRLQADFENYRKRTERESEEYRKYATKDLVSELINVADDLERALASVKEEDALSTGVRAVRGNLMKILEAQGLKEIPTEGKFDPNMHEALMVSEGDEDDMIAEVYQKGYMMNGKVLRYAKVRVTKKKQDAPAEEESAE